MLSCMQTLGAAYGLLRYPLLSQDFPVSAHFYVRGGKGCMSTCDVFSSSWKYKQKGRYIHTLIYFFNKCLGGHLLLHALFWTLGSECFSRGAVTTEIKPHLWRDRVVAISIPLHFCWSISRSEDGRRSRKTVQWNTSAPKWRKEERESLVIAHRLLHSSLLATTSTPFMKVVKTNSIVALPPIQCLLSLQLRVVVESLQAPQHSCQQSSPAALGLPSVAVNS